jgi:GT2 family glycosyltransferase
LDTTALGAPGTRARDRRRASVQDVTVLLFTHPGGPVAVQTLDALADQTRRPDRVVLTGLPAQDDEVAEVREHPLLATSGTELVVREPLTGPEEDEPPLARVVADATAELPVSADSWVWLLHDDSLPEPDALEHLVEATRRSSRVAVVGPKLVWADDPRRLLALGQSATRGGRPADTALPGQIDQGQFDERSDVLGVPLAGMLVRTEVLQELRGLEPAFGDGVEGLDLSWRSHLAGHRVVVAPAAVVRQGTNGLGTPCPLRSRRRLRQAALARDAWWIAPWRALGILLTSLLAGIGLLLVKRPREAGAEFADVSAVLAPWRGWGARWRFRSRRRVRRRDLHGLFAPATIGLRGTTDVVQDALTPGSAGARTNSGARETGPVDEDARSLDSPRPDHRRRWSWPLTVAVGLGTVAAVVRWRELWPGLTGRGYGVHGGDLSVVAADATGVWHAWWDGWRGAGLGQAVVAEPWLLPAAAATWLVEQLPWVDPGRSPAAVATTWLLFAVLPASVLSGYLASRAVLVSRPVRAVVGLVWAGLPPLTWAVADGRPGPAAAHVLMPLVAAGFLVSAGRGEGARRTAAAFATVLALVLLGMVTPALLLLSTGAGLLVLVLGPGWGRLRGLVLALLPWALLGPWVLVAWQDPRLLLGGPGATTTQGRVDPWQTLLLHPGGPQSPALWWTAPLLLLAVLGVLRTGSRGRRAALLVLGALIGLAAALAAPLARLGTVPTGHSDAGAVVTTWPGVFLSLAGACLLLAGGAAVDRVSDAGASRLGWRRPLVGVLGGVTAVAGLAVLVSSSWAGTGAALAVAGAPYPAVVAEQAGSGEAVRIIELVPAGEGLTYRLVGQEPDPWLRDRARELSPVTTSVAGDGRTHLDRTVGALVGRSLPRDVDGTDRAVHDGLHELAVGYVGLRAPDPQDPLVEVLDAVPGLTRLGTSQDVVLWRVTAAGAPDGLVSPSRVRLLDTAGQPLRTVPVTGPHASLAHTLDPPPADALLEVSAGAGWSEHAVVRLDGVAADPQQDRWPPRYAVPDGTRSVSVENPPAHPTWHLVTAVAAGLTAFLALPLGAGRRRRNQ